MLSLAMLVAPAFGATCNAAATGVAFGTYTPNQVVPADSAGSITVMCSKGALDALPLTVTYSVEIGRGTSSSYSPREMTGSSSKLRYNLYRDALRLNIWGDATGGTSNLTGSLLLQSPLGTASGIHSVYARIFAAQNAVPGPYADTVVVTISY
jgi:spore coat protein U-like protein